MVRSIIFLFLLGCFGHAGLSQDAGAIGSEAGDLDKALAEEAEAAKEDRAAGRRGPPGPRSFNSFSVFGQYFPSADVKTGGGSIAETTVGVEFGWTRLAAFNDFRQFTLGYSRRDYDVDRSDPLGSSVTEVNAFRIGGTIQQPFAERWSWFATSRLSLQAGTGAALSDGWNVPFSGGVGYMIHPRLNVSLGVLGTWEAELGVRVIPIAAIRWMPTDRLTIMTLNGVRVSYKMGEKRQWELISSILYETFVFAVDDLDGFREVQGVVSQEYFQARLGLSRSFGPMFEVGAFVEGRFDRNFEYYENDDKFDEIEIEPGLGFRVSGSYRF